MCYFVILLFVFVGCIALDRLQMDKQVNRGRGANKKATGDTRRVWTNREEAVLITALKDLVSNGWKSDNGFRTGYFIKLEESLKQAFPNCGLDCKPKYNFKAHRLAENLRFIGDCPT